MLLAVQPHKDQYLVTWLKRKTPSNWLIPSSRNLTVMIKTVRKKSSLIRLIQEDRCLCKLSHDWLMEFLIISNRTGGLYYHSYGFSSSHVQMWELDHKEGWAPKNRCFRIVVLEKTLKSPLDCKEVKSVSTKGNQLWIFTGRIEAEAEAPILWPPDVKSQFNGKDPDAGKDGRQKKKG